MRDFDLVSGLGECLLHLVDGEFGSIDHNVGFGADGSEDPAFQLDGCFDSLVRPKRMRTASLAETADERFVGGLKKNDPDFQFVADLVEDAWEPLEAVSF